MSFCMVNISFKIPFQQRKHVKRLTFAENLTKFPFIKFSPAKIAFLGNKYFLKLFICDLVEVSLKTTIQCVYKRAATLLHPVYIVTQ